MNHENTFPTFTIRFFQNCDHTLNPVPKLIPKDHIAITENVPRLTLTNLIGFPFFRYTINVPARSESIGSFSGNVNISFWIQADLFPTFAVIVLTVLGVLGLGCFFCLGRFLFFLRFFLASSFLPLLVLVLVLTKDLVIFIMSSAIRPFTSPLSTQSAN